MHRTYGNRIPPTYRWAVATLVLVSLLVLGAATFAGLVSPLPAVVILVLGVVVTALYRAGGTTVSADAETVRVALFPLWRRRIPFRDIGSIAVEPVTPLEREWGNRGSLRRNGEIFVDAGQSRTCLAFHLIDGTIIRIGVSSVDVGQNNADTLDHHRARSGA